ncbi:MAG TPA: GNAT family N-acetyltransferase [Thermoanaerobaculia bacterium]|nr:GNAT family N-acetyltransferase [Thermoanaerobaculia bacterium]
MSKLTTATTADLPAIRSLFARASDISPDLAAVAEEKCFSPGFRGSSRVRCLFDRNELQGVAVTCGRHLRIVVVDPGQRRKGIGTMLIGDAEEQVRSSRSPYLEVASEAGNYFTPGIPFENHETIAFFEARGFSKKDEALNLRVPLRNNPLIPASRDLDQRIERGSSATRSGILQFIGTHFGPIWQFEAGKAFESDPPTIFIAKLEGVIAGFTVHDVNNRGLGSFGPEGVDPSVRGQGLGRSLLLASLADLRDRGFLESTIPWASSVDFYTKSCGAVVSGRFVILAKRLEM